MVSEDTETSSEDMEIDIEPEVSTKEILIFMEFDRKMKDYLFDGKIFFRMTRLEENPLIQINNHIFKGEYRSCTGTNLFFSDYEKQQQENLFRNQCSIRLKHVATQMKTLILNPVRIPSDMANLPQPLHDIQINDKYDTKSLLKKFAHGSLNLKEDLVVVPWKRNNETAKIPENTQVKGDRKNLRQGSKGDPSVKLRKNREESQTKTYIKTKKESALSKLGLTPVKSQNEKVTIDILTYKFDKLKQLALRPTRRRKEPEAIAECDDKYKKAYDYNCLKCTIIKPSDYFRTISENFNEKTLVGAVDIDRSVLQGVIDPSPQLYRVLTEEEKVALLSIRNLENLSMAARYKVIKSHLDHLTSSVGTLCKEEESEKISYRRTTKDTIEIYRRLLRVLGGIVTQKYCYDSDVEDD